MITAIQRQNQDKGLILWEREMYFLFHETLGRAKRLIEIGNFENPFDDCSVQRLRDLVDFLSLSEREFKEIVFWKSIAIEEQDRQLLAQERARRRWEIV